MVTYDGMKKFAFILLAFAIVLFGGAMLFKGKKGGNTAKTTHPEYVNFSGGYVFSVPDTFIVDEQSDLGKQLIYTGQLTAKNLEELYSGNGISVQQIVELSDRSSGGFKKYVNETVMPAVKKDISDDVELKFIKSDDIDAARISVKKDGQQARFIFLRGGNHPVIVVSKDETDQFKKITGTIIDVEKSDLKDDIEAIKQAIRDDVQLIKQQNATELHTKGTPDWQSKNSKEQVAAAFKAAESITKTQNVAIAGGVFNNGEFTSAIRFSPLGKDNEATLGTLSFQKVDGQWKIFILNLPAPAPAPPPTR